MDCETTKPRTRNILFRPPSNFPAIIKDIKKSFHHDVVVSKKFTK